MLNNNIDERIQTYKSNFVKKWNNYFETHEHRIKSKLNVDQVKRLKRLI